MEKTTIEYINKAECCSEHNSERSIWASIKNSVNQEFTDFNEENRTKIMICWYEQSMLDKRTEMIQGFKKQNIKAING